MASRPIDGTILRRTVSSASRRTVHFRERELERGLLIHLRDLLLELGRGFAFVGAQVPLPVGNETYYLDPRSALLPCPAPLLFRRGIEDRPLQTRVRGLWKAGRYEKCSIDSPEIRGLPIFFLHITSCHVLSAKALKPVQQFSVLLP